MRMFTDKCNECSKPIEIDLDTMIFTANCCCDSDIKKSMMADKTFKIQLDEDIDAWKQRMLRPPRKKSWLERLLG
jgi:hypothetical protein